MRNLKILGLAFVAMLAMSAMASATASADDLTAEAAPVTLTGAKDGTFVDETTTTAGVVKCPEPTYHGTLSTTATTTLTITPNYNDKLCTAFGFPEATVTMNGCDYLFHINAGSGVVGTEGTVDLVCPAGQEVTFTAKSVGITKCVVHVPAQNSIPGKVTYTNIGAGTTREITISAELTGTKYTHTKGEGIGACAAGSAVNGQTKIKAIFTGENEGTKAHIGIFLS